MTKTLYISTFLLILSFLVQHEQVYAQDIDLVIPAQSCKPKNSQIRIDVVDIRRVGSGVSDNSYTYAISYEFKVCKILADNEKPLTDSELERLWTYWHNKFISSLDRNSRITNLTGLLRAWERSQDLGTVELYIRYEVREH